MNVRRLLSTASLVGALAGLAPLNLLDPATLVSAQEMPPSEAAKPVSPQREPVYACTHLAAPVSRYKSINRGPNRAERRFRIRQRCKRGRIASEE